MLDCTLRGSAILRVGGNNMNNLVLRAAEAAEGVASAGVDGVGEVVSVELCTAADVKAAHVALLSRLARPNNPQPPALELVRAPVWSTWARYKMDVDQPKV